MKRELTIIDIIRLFTKNTKLFILTGSAALVLSVIISLLLPVYYKSTCILYPFNPEAYDPRNVDKAATPYGTTFDGDRIMALAESREVQNSIVKKYNLLTRYKIDPTDPIADVKVREKLSSNMTVSENSFSAIEISVFDTDPDTAAMIVNDIVAKVDELNKKPLIEINQKIFESYEQIVAEKYQDVDSLQQAFDKIEVKSAKNRSDIFSMEMVSSMSDLKAARKSLELIKSDFSSINIIQPAEAIAKKAKPQRSIIVIVSVVATLALTFLVLLISAFFKITLENEKQLNA